MAEVRVEPARSVHWEWSGEGGFSFQVYRNWGSSFHVEGSRSSGMKSCLMSLSRSLPAAVTRTAIRCCRQVPGSFPAISGEAPDSPAVSHRREHTCENRLMRLSPDRRLQREREAGEGCYYSVHPAHLPSGTQQETLNHQRASEGLSPGPLTSLAHALTQTCP